jgi:branched-chain amino acid transport system permease protein
LQLSRTIWVLLMVILGGAAYFWGPVVGTIVAVGLDVLISQYSERYNLVIGVIFLLVILFAPNGILGGLERFRSKRPRAEVLATDAGVPATEAVGPATDAVVPATEGSGRER